MVVRYGFALRLLRFNYLKNKTRNMLKGNKRNKLWCVVAVFVIAALNTAVAQNCDSLVQPKFADAPGYFSQLPQHKIQHYCNFAHSAFYWSDTLPQNAVVYNISDVSSKATRRHISQNANINLEFFSYYAYNFDEFQYRHYHDFIYFRVNVGNGIKYLVLRDINTIFGICARIENN